MTVIDGELWFRAEDGEPEKAKPANPAITEAVAGLGPGWHYGHIEKVPRLRRIWERVTQSGPMYED